MIVKGLVSAIDTEKGIVDVILPECNGVVVRPSKLYHEEKLQTLKINDFVLVVVFNNDYNDCIIL